MVEPEWYLPIIPMVLVNGTEGIGTGWSTNIPCFNPRELVESLKCKLKGEEFKDIDPWFKGFSGEIIKNPKGGYIINGRCEANDEDGLIDITELPIQKWTKDYKTFLEDLASSEKGEIEEIKEYHTNNRVHFNIKPTNYQNFVADLEKKLKLQSSIQITNMVLFDEKGKLKKYTSVKEILKDFYTLRINFYLKRKVYLVSRLKRDLELISNKCRFILAVISEKIQVRNIKKKDICRQLLEEGFVQMKNMPKIESTKPQFLEKKTQNENENENEEIKEIEEKATEVDILSKEYSYLLGMPIYSLSFEKVEELKKEKEKKQEELKIILQTKEESMWLNDLDQFLIVLDEVEEDEEKNRLNRPKTIGNAGKKARAKPNKKKIVEEVNQKENENASGKKPAKTKVQKEKKEIDEKIIKKDKQSTLNLEKTNPKNQTIAPSLSLEERIKTKMDSQTSSSAFKKGYEAEKNKEPTKKKKATSALEGKPILKRKIIESDDEEEFDFDILKKESKSQSSNINSVKKIRSKVKKVYLESEEEEMSDSDSVFEIN